MNKKFHKWILFSLLAFTTVFVIVFIRSRAKKNVILITVDTLRADYLSCFNKNAARTPEIDSLARNGVLFSKAYTLMPVTLPAHASILTSRPPHELRLFNNGQVYRQEFPLMSELLKKENYATAAFISLGVLRKKVGLSRGFQTYHDDFSLGPYKTAAEVNSEVFSWLDRVRDTPFFAWIHYSDPHEPYLSSRKQVDTEVLIDGISVQQINLGDERFHELHFRMKPGKSLLEFRPILRNKQDQRARYLQKLICVPSSIQMNFREGWRNETSRKGITRHHFDSRAIVELVSDNPTDLDVQFRFLGASAQTAETAMRNYIEEVQAVDSQIGALRRKIRELGIEPKTIFVLTSDHGEGLRNHGVMGHGYPLYNELLHVPLVIYDPGGGHTNRRVDELVDHLDILPTILDLLHLDDRPVMRGRSLASELSWSPLNWLYAKEPERRLVFAATPDGVANSFAVQDGRFKLIQTRARVGWIYQAFDLTKDPAERTSLFRQNPALLEQSPFAEWKKLLLQFASVNENARKNVNKERLTPEDAEMLEALGYVGE